MTTKDNLEKLPQHADSIEFKRWFKLLMHKGERDIGYGNLMYVPKADRGTRQPFDPQSKPIEKAVSWEAILNGLNLEIRTLQGQVYDDKRALQVAEKAVYEAENPSVEELAVAELTKCHNTLRDRETALEESKRKLENRYKAASDEQARYLEAMKRHERLTVIHDKWVSLLKEHLDSFDANAIKDKPTFYRMIDEMYGRCNSQQKGNMITEWNRRWAATEGIFPPALTEWSDLRERYFEIHGLTDENDITLTYLFKERLQEVVPKDEILYTSLLAAIQTDVIEEKLRSARLLKFLDDIEGRRIRSKPVEKTSAMKSKLENLVKPKLTKHSKKSGGKFCTHHKSNTHSTEECKVLKGRKHTDRRMEKHKSPKTQSNNWKKIMEGEIEYLKAKLAEVTSADSQKIRLLRINTGEKYFRFSDDISDQQILSIPRKFLDSGCNRHITPDITELSNLQKVANKFVYDATNTPSQADQTGDMQLDVGTEQVTLRNVLHCPNLSDTLISPSYWLRNSEDRIVLTDQHAYYRPAGTQNHFEIARVIDGMYHIVPTADKISQKIVGTQVTEPSQVKANVAKAARASKPRNTVTEEDVVQTIHRRFAHFNLRSIAITLKNNPSLNNDKLSHAFLNNPDLHSQSILEQCVDCAQGKIRRGPIERTDTPPEEVLEIIHTDCFPLPCESPQRELHGTIVIDGRSRWCEVVFHRSKSESSHIVKQKILLWEAQHEPRRVGTIRHDGGELRMEFDQFCRTRMPPIQNQTSPSYVKELNGLAERNYGVHKANAITLNLQAKLPQRFTKYALQYSIHVRNRMSHPDEPSTSPFELWYGRKPDLTSLRPYGCLVTIWLAKEQRQNFYSPRGMPAIFLGYQGNHLIVVFVLSTKRIVTVNHYQFHEHIFPGLLSPYNDARIPNFRGEIGDTHEIVEVPAITDTALDSAGITADSADITTDPTPPTPLSQSQMNLEILTHEPVDSTNSPDDEDNMVVLLGEDEEDESDDADRIQEMSDHEEDVPIVISKATQAEMRSWGMNSVIISRNRKRKRLTYDSTPRKANRVMDVPKHGQSKDTPPPNSISMDGISPPPKTRTEMLKHKFKDYWIEAEKTELNAMENLKVWRRTSKPRGRRLLRPKWIYTYKVNKDTNTVARFKARLVAMGNTQTQGVDYKDTFSPVVKIQSLRIMIALSLRDDLIIEQIDIDTAYLNADIDILNYMSMPEGYEEFDDNNQPYALELLKSLYGLHQSGREWNKHIVKFLISIEFKQAISDLCLFYRKRDSCFILLYVDDLIIMAPSREVIKSVKDELRKIFKIKDIGDARFALGLQIERVDGGIYVGQLSYTQAILRMAGMEDCQPKQTPMITDWAHDDNSPELDNFRQLQFRSLLMKLSYLAQQTRPDIIYAVNTLAQYQTDCREHEWKALMRICRYLKRTWDYGLYFSKDNNPLACLVTNDDNFLDDMAWYPLAYADASYARERDRKSRSGHVFLMRGAAVSWFCKKQPVVALSSTEAEYYALSEAVKEALWVRQLLTEVGFTLNDPVTIHQDNLSTIAIATNPIQHQRVKHMDVKVHFLRDHLDRQDIQLTFCPTKEMVADILTKPLPPLEHRKFTQLMGLRSLHALQGIKPDPFNNDRGLHILGIPTH